MNNHIVFMVDGTKSVVDDAGLIQIAKASEASEAAGNGVTYNGARNADLPRFVSSAQVNQQDFSVTIKVTDLASGTETLNDPSTNAPWANKAAADAYTAAMNSTMPTMIQFYSGQSS